VTTAQAPELEIILVPHTHWDREWYLPFEAFRHRLVRLLDRLTAIMEADPDYKFFHLDGQTIVLEDYEEIRGPEPRLRALIQQGRIHIGPWYVLPDEFLVSGEAIIRNLQEGFRVARGYGAEPVPVGYLPDMFGHIGQMPQILRGFGLDNAVVWRGITADVTSNHFTWQAPDGTAVLGIFLPLGYGFAFALPADPKLLIERLQIFLLALKKNETTGIVLLPNGTDHWEPQPEIPATLKAVQALKPNWRLEMGNLPLYLKRVRERIQDPPAHQGELYSAERTSILPSVASARLYLKQADFRAGAALERYLEPLAVLARASAGPDLTDHLRYLWRLLLENHPHDSICGCSVDAVHDEMETRYAKLNQLADRLLGDALAVVAQGLPGPGPRLGAFFPNAAAGAGPLRGEVEMRLPAQAGLVAASGESVPLQAEKLEREKQVFEITVPKIAAGIALDMLAVEEQIGAFMVGYRLKRQGATLHLTMDLASRRAAFDLARFRQEMEKHLADPSLALLHIELKRLPRYQVAAALPARPGAAVSSWQVKRARKGPAATDLQAGPGFLENAHLRVDLTEQGRLTVADKAGSLQISGLRFLDVGDRGDEYNFDPVAGDTPISEPASFQSKLLAPGPALAEFTIRHRFRIPAELAPGRQGRSRRMVPLELVTRISLGQDSRVVEFRTAFFNRAKDHRLQVAFDAPLATDHYLAESAFGAVKRPIQPTRPAGKPSPLDINAILLGTEGTYGTSPHKTYAAVSDGKLGMALFNRGLAEVEAVKLPGQTRLALTLVRSVGWLSRPDLRQRSQHAGPPMSTPGGQCLRDFVCEYAVTGFAGSAEEAALAAQAHAFAFPPLLFPAPGQGAGPAEARLVAVDNPQVELSAFVPVTADAFDLRLYNTSFQPQACGLSWHPALRAEAVVNLLGEKVVTPEFRLEPAGAALKLRPGQIITLRMALAK
jgi:hypothetical protein